MSPRRRIKRKPLWLTLFAASVGCLSYILLLPIWQAQGSLTLSPQDLYGSRIIDVLIFTWCLWIGASVGSFLNVVAWRMPRGQSVNGRSHCPRCQAKLRARDNVPILGWLSLGGRCYCCRLPISVRYPIVELAVGLSLALVAFAEIYRINLPRQFVRHHVSPFAMPIIETQSVLLMLYHIVALAFSWACGLIRLDGHGLPKILIKLSLVFAVLPILAEPNLMVLPWQVAVASDWSSEGRYLDAVMRVLTSFVAATVMARILVPAFCPNADLKLDPLGKSSERLVDLIVILAIPSLVVGWHALPAIVLIASVFAAILQPKFDWKKDALGCFAVAIPVALAIQILFWRSLHAPLPFAGTEQGTWLWPSEGGLPWVILGWFGMTLLISFWLRDIKKTVSPSPLLEGLGGAKDPEEFEESIPSKGNEYRVTTQEGVSPDQVTSAPQEVD